MKILALLLILTPLFHVAQKNTFTTTHANLSFDYYKKNLTDVVKGEIDSIWDIMKNGSEAEFHLLSKEEKKKLPNDHQYKVTAMRADSVLAYLHRKRIAPKYTQLKTKYFEGPPKDTVHLIAMRPIGPWYSEKRRDLSCGRERHLFA